QDDVVDRVEGGLPDLGVVQHAGVVRYPDPVTLRRDQTGFLEGEDEPPHDRDQAEDPDQDHRGKDEGPARSVIGHEVPADSRHPPSVPPPPGPFSATSPRSVYPARASASLA